MARVCPWWWAWTFDNPLRRLFFDPARLFGPHVGPGMTVLDAGCGLGFNALALARLVGEAGRVLAVDLQPRMLKALGRRAARAGLASRIELRECEADSIGVRETVDFVNAFWMAHELPDARAFLRETHACLRPGARLLVAEPRHHVSRKAFGATVAAAQELGFELLDEPRVAFSRAAVFVRR